MAFTHTTDGGDLRSPWSSCPGYTSLQVADFNRAGEQALLVKASVDLGKAAGLEGVHAYAAWVHGWGRAAAPDRDEIDLDFQWRPAWRRLPGFSLRLRYAYFEEHDGGHDALTDFRAILNYDVDLL